MIETLRPNSAGDVAEHTVSGASNYAALSDSSDATYIRNNTGVNKTDAVNLGASALTSQTILSVGVRVRARSESSAASQFQAGLRLGGTDSLAPAHTNVPTTATDFTDTAIPRPGGGSWSVSDLNALQFVVVTNDGSSAAIRVFEAYVDVNYAGGTVVSGSASLSGASAAGAAGMARVRSAASITTAVTMSVQPIIRVRASVAAQGSSTAAGAARQRLHARPAAVGSGTVAAAVLIRITGSGQAAGSGTAVTTADQVRGGQVLVSGSSSAVILTPKLRVRAANAISGAGTVFVAAVIRKAGTAAAAGHAHVVGMAVVRRRAALLIEGTSYTLITVPGPALPSAPIRATAGGLLQSRDATVRAAKGSNTIWQT